MSSILQILNFLLTLLEVIVLFNLIIIAHEWGHFLAARWRGLKIEEFGVWFGKPLWKKKINGVVYSLGTIPAGGFVKLPQLAPMDIIEGESDAPRETLPPISPLDKTIVAFAGPLFSFLFAVVLACVVWLPFVGKPVAEADSTTIIGYVTPGSPADSAGLKPGDRILAVDGNPVKGFRAMTKSVIWYIVRSEGEKIQFTVERDGKVLKLDSGSVYQREAIVSKVKPGSPAAQAGLATDDWVAYVNGVQLLSPEDFQKFLIQGGKPLYITFVRDDQWINCTLNPVAENGAETGIEWKSNGWGRAALRKVGIAPSETAKVKSVKAGSPAADAQLAPGDIIYYVNGQRLFTPLELDEISKKDLKQPLNLTVQRGSEWLNVTLHPKLGDSSYTDKEKENFDTLLGIEWDPMISRIWPTPMEQISDSTNGIKNMLGALFSPKSGIKAQHFSGPVGIGLMYFRMLLSPEGWRLALAFSVFFNVNLALLNLLPFPVLDGGHIVLAFIEGIRRKPVNIKVLEVIQTACALLLFGFIIYVTRYDVLDLPWKKLLPSKETPELKSK